MMASDGEAPILENLQYPFIAITPSLLRSRVVIAVKVISMVRIELFNLYTYIHLTVCKQMTDVKLKF